MMNHKQEADEQWKPCPGFESSYAVSDHGNVIRYAYNDRSVQKLSCNPLKSYHDSRGYSVVSPYVNGKKYTTTVHKLVAMAFIGPRPEGFQVNHKDGIKTNNHVSNLEYVTNMHNTQHAMILGLRDHLRGDGNHFSKLNKEKIKDIRKRASMGEPRASLAAEYDVTVTSIGNIIRRDTWSWVHES